MNIFNIDPKIKVKKVEELIDVPITITVNEFNDKSAKQFRDDFTRASNTGQDIIPIVIDSYGGEVYSLLSMVGTIKSSTRKIATYATGKAMSCGSVLLSCGTEGMRYIDPVSTVMIHQVSSGVHGKNEDVKVSAAQTDKLNNQIMRLMALNVGKPENYFLDLINEHKQADIYLDPEACKLHNIVNHIRTPKFKVSIKTEISFE